MARTRTTWEDLSNLGWPKQQVYNKLNAERGKTMQGFGDIALNDKFAVDYAWYCYNDFKGSPQASPPNIKSSVSDTIVWEYKNTTSDEFKDTWTESWENTEQVDSAVSTQATIGITSSITVGGVFDAGFSFTFQANTSQAQSKVDKQTLSHTWDLVVPPGGHRRLIRKRTVTTGTQEHRVKYGLATGGDKIGTKGKKWNGHYYWYYSANAYLNSPSGTMVITSFLNQKSFFFIYEDVHPDGRRVEIPIEFPRAKHAPIKSTTGAVAGALDNDTGEPDSGPGPGVPPEEDEEDDKDKEGQPGAGSGKEAPITA